MERTKEDKISHIAEVLMNKIYIIATVSVESFSIFAICKSEETAKKKFYELKNKLLDEFQEMMRDDPTHIYDRLYNYVSKCEFPNICPSGQYVHERPYVEEYELLE